MQARLKPSLTLAFLVALTAAPCVFAEISRECVDGKECLIEVPGTTCADGSPSFMTLTKRPGAKNLLIYMRGGGGCWSAESCQKGYARPLKRMELRTEWTGAHGIHNASDPGNPFARDYNVITIPYCTGDVYAGDRDADYGGGYVIKHRGYRNVQLTLDAARKLYPQPEKAVLVGCSAGAIGAYYHLRNFRATFPQARKYVVSDAGTPFKPPYIHPQNYEYILKTWGADSTLPVPGPGEAAPRDFSAIMAYNTRHYPEVRFGFISTYRDEVMTKFAYLAGSPNPLTAVHDAIIDAANNSLGRTTAHAKVFYSDESDNHCQTPIDLDQVKSRGVSLGSWLTGLVEEGPEAWENQRPDLEHDIAPAVLRQAD